MVSLSALDVTDGLGCVVVGAQCNLWTCCELSSVLDVTDRLDGVDVGARCGRQTCWCRQRSLMQPRDLVVLLLALDGADDDDVVVVGAQCGGRACCATSSALTLANGLDGVVVGGMATAYLVALWLAWGGRARCRP